MWRYREAQYEGGHCSQFICFDCAPTVDHAYRRILGKDRYNKIFPKIRKGDLEAFDKKLKQG